MIYDLAVVGGGPAGLSAAVQARVRGKSVLIVSGDVRDNALYKAQQALQLQREQSKLQRQERCRERDAAEQERKFRLRREKRREKRRGH